MGFGLSKGGSSKSTTDVNQDINSQSGMNFNQGSGYEGSQGYGYGSGGNQNYGGGANYGQNVWNPGAQQGMQNNLNNMWGGFQGQQGGMNNMAGQAGGYNQGVAQGAMNPWQNQMAGGAQGAAGQQMSPALMNSLQQSLGGGSQTGDMYANIMGGPGNTYGDRVAQDMRNESTLMADRQAGGMGTLQGVGAGQSGGSPQLKQEALMRSEMARKGEMGINSMQERNFDTDLNWKMNIAQQADANRGAAQDRAIGLMSGGDQNTQYGMQNAPGMQNLGMGMMNPGMTNAAMPFEMAGQYSNAMGGPTVLGQGSQQNFGQGNQFDQGGGYNNTSGGSYGEGSSFEDYNSQYDFHNKSKGKGGWSGTFGGK